MHSITIKVLVAFVLARPLLVAISDGPVRQAPPPADIWVASLLSRPPRLISVDPKNPRLQVKVVEDTDPHSPRYGVKLCWIVLPKREIGLRVNDLRRLGRSDGIYEAAAQARDIVVADGGYFGYGAKNQYIPIGLVVENGAKRNTQSRWSSGGVLIQEAGRIAVVAISNFRMSPEVEHAVQSKPMLVERGRSVIRSDPQPPFNRTAVGIASEGNIIIAGAFRESE